MLSVLLPFKRFSAKPMASSVPSKWLPSVPPTTAMAGLVSVLPVPIVNSQISLPPLVLASDLTLANDGKALAKALIRLDCSAKLLGLVFQYEPSREDVVLRPGAQSVVPANTSLGRVVLIRQIMEEFNRLLHKESAR